MSISSITTGSLSYLSELLYENTASSTTSTTAASTTSATSTSAASTKDTFRSELSTLESDIQSGNLTAAKADLAKIQQSKPHGSTNGTDPLGTFLTSVDKALSSGDISSAQSALATFKAAPKPGSSSASGGDFDKELSGLESAIQSGDLKTAEKYLTELQQGAPSSSASTSTDSATSSSVSTSSSSNAATDPIGTFLKSVESAIANGSLAAAQSALSTFQSQPIPGFTAGASTTAASTISLVA